MAHTCDALVVSCIDFRLQKYIRNWLDTEMKDKTFDYVGYGGCAKDMDVVMKQMEISVKLHDIKEVVLMNHEECGAYGAESTPERHAADLKHAREVIHATYPHLAVRTFYLHLDGQFEEIQ